MLITIVSSLRSRGEVICTWPPFVVESEMKAKWVLPSNIDHQNTSMHIIFAFRNSSLSDEARLENGIGRYFNLSLEGNRVTATFQLENRASMKLHYLQHNDEWHQFCIAKLEYRQYSKRMCAARWEDYQKKINFHTKAMMKNSFARWSIHFDQNQFNRRATHLILNHFKSLERELGQLSLSE